VDGDPKTDAVTAIGVNEIGHHVLILLHGQQNPNPQRLSQSLLPRQSLKPCQKLLLRKRLLPRQTGQQTPALAMELTGRRRTTTLRQEPDRWGGRGFSPAFNQQVLFTWATGWAPFAIGWICSTTTTHSFVSLICMPSPFRTNQIA
jgi:hypothetical protein